MRGTRSSGTTSTRTGRTTSTQQKRATPTRTETPDRGTMAIEMVILAPILLMFVLLVVAFGRYVAVRGDVEAASRDAVRAATMERDSGLAATVATQTANAALGGRWTCTAAERSGAFTSGGTITITLTCQVPWSGLGLIGLSGSKTVEATSSAPLDLYRRTG